MKDTELEWVVNMWQGAMLLTDSLDVVCDALYGAAQAANQLDAMEHYEVYSLLVRIARIHRFDAITERYKAAA